MDAQPKTSDPKPDIISACRLMEKIPDEQSAIAHLTPILWPDGPICPYCGSKEVCAKAGEGKENFQDCRKCHWDFTIRVDTIFHRSHVPLHKWFYAMYQTVTAMKGVSSMQLSKGIGVTQKTAWFLLQRIRAACGN